MFCIPTVREENDENERIRSEIQKEMVESVRLTEQGVGQDLKVSMPTWI